MSQNRRLQSSCGTGCEGAVEEKNWSRKGLFQKSWEAWFLDKAFTLHECSFNKKNINLYYLQVILDDWRIVFSLWAIIISQKEKNISKVAIFKFLQYFSLSLPQRKKYTAFDTSTYLYVNIAPRRISAWNKKTHKLLSCAQNPTEGQILHARTQISEMSTWQLQVWSLVKQITLWLWGLEQKTCKPKYYLLKTHPTALFIFS